MFFIKCFFWWIYWFALTYTQRDFQCTVLLQGHTLLKYTEISLRFQGNNFKIFPCLFDASFFKQDSSFSRGVTNIKYPSTQEYYVTRILLHVAVLCVRARVCACVLFFVSELISWLVNRLPNQHVHKERSEFNYWTILWQECTVLFWIFGTFRYSLFSIILIMTNSVCHYAGLSPLGNSRTNEKISPFYLPSSHVIPIKTESAQLSPRYWHPHWFSIDFIGFRVFHFMAESVCERACLDDTKTFPNSSVKEWSGIKRDIWFYETSRFTFWSAVISYGSENRKSIFVS